MFLFILGSSIPQNERKIAKVQQKEWIGSVEFPCFIPLISFFILGGSDVYGSV